MSKYCKDKQKRWILIGWDNCPYCGDSPEIFTDKENEVYDGDPIQCSACGCPGSVTVYEDGDCYINWHDDPNCDCNWCLAHPVK